MKPAHYEHVPASALLPSEKATDTDSSDTTKTAPNSSGNDFHDDPDYMVYLPSCEEPSPQQVELRKRSRERRPPARYGNLIAIPDSVTFPILEEDSGVCRHILYLESKGLSKVCEILNDPSSLPPAMACLDSDSNFRLQL